MSTYTRGGKRSVHFFVSFPRRSFPRARNSRWNSPALRTAARFAAVFSFFAAVPAPDDSESDISVVYLTLIEGKTNVTLQRMDFTWSLACAPRGASGISRIRAVRYQLYEETNEISGGKGAVGTGGEGGREGERISLTFISGARWRNGGETRLARHVGENWLRKHCAAYYYVIRPAWLLCYHFSWSSGESANEINLITREAYRDGRHCRRKTEKTDKRSGTRR